MAQDQERTKSVDSGESEKGHMPFLDHLEELRWRLIRSAVAIILGGSLAFFFKTFLFNSILFAPKGADFITFRAFCSLSHHIGLGNKLCIEGAAFEVININMAGQFTTHVMVSVLAGFVLAFPYIFYQFWAFLSPGLHDNERRSARGIVLFCTLLFLLGIAFGYFIISPLSVRFLGSYQVTPDVPNQIRLGSFISTVATVTVSAGILFQLPVVIYLLSWLGLITPDFLKQYRKHALVVVLVMAAIITPPDITSQILVALPLLVLYEVSIMISKKVTEKRAARMENS